MTIIDWANLNLEPQQSTSLFTPNPMNWGMPTQLPGMQALMPKMDPSLEGFNAYAPNAGGPPTAATPKFGNNLPTWSLGFQGLTALTNLWQGLEANKIAKSTLNMNREFGNANLNNSIRAYNTNLEGRANLKRQMSGWSDQEMADYIAANKATR